MCASRDPWRYVTRLGNHHDVRIYLQTAFLGRRADCHGCMSSDCHEIYFWASQLAKKQPKRMFSVRKPRHGEVQLYTLKHNDHKDDKIIRSFMRRFVPANQDRKEVTRRESDGTVC